MSVEIWDTKEHGNIPDVIPQIKLETTHIDVSIRCYKYQSFSSLCKVSEYEDSNEVSSDFKKNVMGRLV